MPKPTIGNLKANKLRRTFLREWRKFRGLSLEKAGELIGVSHATLSRIERGVAPYAQPMLEQAAEVYGCSTAELLGRSPHSPEAESIAEAYEHATAERKRIAEDLLLKRRGH
jgi:transcriptional regulator with XRE-family HTH domain